MAQTQPCRQALRRSRLRLGRDHPVRGRDQLAHVRGGIGFKIEGGGQVGIDIGPVGLTRKKRPADQQCDDLKQQQRDQQAEGREKARRPWTEDDRAMTFPSEVWL